MFMTGAWEFAAPVAQGDVSGAQGLAVIYKLIGKQLGLSLFLPLAVGQVILK